MNYKATSYTCFVNKSFLFCFSFKQHKVNVVLFKLIQRSVKVVGQFDTIHLSFKFWTSGGIWKIFCNFCNDLVSALKLATVLSYRVPKVLQAILTKANNPRKNAEVIRMCYLKKCNITLWCITLRSRMGKFHYHTYVSIWKWPLLIHHTHEFLKNACMW